MRNYARPPRPLRGLIRVGGWLILAAAVTWMWSPRGGSDDTRDAGDLERELAPAAGAASREGIAAVVLMDVSGSMADSVGRDVGGQQAKLDIARRAALDLVRQFDAYARAHPGEPVLVGLFEFSEVKGHPSTREVIPLSTPDLARAQTALAGLRANGGTPIGDALVAGTHALDAAGLTRRHLLVVTDGENTTGYEPVDVVNAVGRRPEGERPSMYFVAFDIEESRFNAVREAGGLVLAAADADELNATLSSLLTGKILVEGP